MVARGAGTGLSGGALPVTNGIVLSLARLNRILAMDPVNRTARVQPGVRNLAISEAAGVHGLYYAPDPSSQIACTIGGNVAENSGGVHCLKYGLTVHNVLALKLVTMDGELVELGGETLDSPGYDLLALAIGSEGMLGVVVEVTVRLLPDPGAGAGGAGRLRRRGEGGHRGGRHHRRRHHPGRAGDDGRPGDPGGGGLRPRRLSRPMPPPSCCARWTAPTRRSRSTSPRCASCCWRAAPPRCALPRTTWSAQRFWQGRKSAFPAVGRISPDYYCMDGTIPRRKLPEVLRRTAELSEEYGLPVANVFHAGDGNMHPLILYNANNPGELERTEELGGRILELCVEVGGTITGEHGVGIEKIRQMCVQFDKAELAQFNAVKRAFDPKGLLNPGKGVPTPRRCSEYRQLPDPTSMTTPAQPTDQARDRDLSRAGAAMTGSPICWIYKSPVKDEMYLYLAKERRSSTRPQALAWRVSANPCSSWSWRCTGKKTGSRGR